MTSPDIPANIRAAVSRLDDLVARDQFDPTRRDEFHALAQSALNSDPESLRRITAVINLPDNFTVGAFLREVLRALAKRKT